MQTAHPRSQIPICQTCPNRFIYCIETLAFHVLRFTSNGTSNMPSELQSGFQKLVKTHILTLLDYPTVCGAPLLVEKEIA